MVEGRKTAGFISHLDVKLQLYSWFDKAEDARCIFTLFRCVSIVEWAITVQINSFGWRIHVSVTSMQMQRCWRGRRVAFRVPLEKKYWRKRIIRKDLRLSNWLFPIKFHLPTQTNKNSVFQVIMSNIRTGTLLLNQTYMPGPAQDIKPSPVCLQAQQHVLQGSHVDTLRQNEGNVGGPLRDKL